MPRSFRPRPGHSRSRPSGSIDQVIQQARDAALERQKGYRARSLELFGWICAKCAREFEASNLHLLTVHHRDGNHHYNPPDGSNWENLCVDCHEDEHSRGLLGDYLSGGDKGAGRGGR